MTSSHAWRYLTPSDRTSLPSVPDAALAALIGKDGKESLTLLCLPNNKTGDLAAGMLRNMFKQAGIPACHWIDDVKKNPKQCFWINNAPLPVSLLIDCAGKVHEAEQALSSTPPSPLQCAIATLLRCIKETHSRILIFQSETENSLYSAIASTLHKGKMPLKGVIRVLQHPEDLSHPELFAGIHAVISPAYGAKIHNALVNICAPRGISVQIIPKPACDQVSIASQSVHCFSLPAFRLRAGAHAAAEAAALAVACTTVLSNHPFKFSLKEEIICAALEFTPLPDCLTPRSIVPCILADRIETPEDLAATLSDWQSPTFDKIRTNTPCYLGIEQALYDAYVARNGEIGGFDEIFFQDQGTAHTRTGTTLLVGSSAALEQMYRKK